MKKKSHGRREGARGCERLNVTVPPRGRKEQSMELLEQCSRWNEAGKYQAIVDALEAIPDEERTPEMDSELARAYNNLADPDQPEGAAMLRRAVELLLRHEEYFLGDHCWNFRLGYAWFYLDQEGRALPCFREALKARPGDEDTH